MLAKTAFNLVSTSQSTASKTEQCKHSFFNLQNGQIDLQSQKDMESQDFNQFNKKVLELEQKIIRQQIQKFDKMNLQKQFPALLKKIKSKSENLTQIQNKFNKIKSKKQNQAIEIQKQKQKVLQQLEILKNKLFQIESGQLLKHSYEKQLVVGLIDSLQFRNSQLLQQKSELFQEKQSLNEKKHQFQEEISKQKQMITQLIILKSKMLEELNYTKNCQIQPIHLIHQKVFKRFQQKANNFTSTYFNQCNQNIDTNSDTNNNIIHNQWQQHLILNDCYKIDSLTEKQFLSNQNREDKNHNLLIKQSLNATKKLHKLKNKLKQLTLNKISTNFRTNLQLLKKKSLEQEIIEKQSQILKFHQLLEYVQAQPQCVELINSEKSTLHQDFFDTHVLSLHQLEDKTRKEFLKNQSLKGKLQTLFQKLETVKFTNQNLKTLAIQQKQHSNMRVNKLISQNNCLKNNLIKNRIFCEQRANKAEQVCFQEIHQKQQQKFKPQKLNHLNTKPIKQKQLFRQISLNSKLGQKIQSYDKTLENSKKRSLPQSEDLSVRLTQLRKRLQVKFQNENQLKNRI